MKDLLKELTEDLGEKFEIFMCAQAFEEGGIEKLYKETLKSEKEARKSAKKEEGKQFNETHFQVGRVYSRIKKVSHLLKWIPIMDKEEDRKIIADELTALAEELRNIK